eukprot:jgi/Orpsp1_1/1180538/evm.model.c7180000073811.1
MSNNRRNNNVNTNPNGISFTYKENFNRAVNLTTENYPSWKTNLLYLLDINNLIDYVNLEKIKKFKRSKITDNINEYVQDKLDRSLVTISIMPIKHTMLLMECTTKPDDEHLQIWHRRLAYFNIRNIVNNLPNVHTNNKCKILGPITESLYGNKYILTILDDFTRYNWVYFIKNKSDTFGTFKMWYNIARNIYNSNLKNIRIDNGSEFLNNQFKGSDWENYLYLAEFSYNNAIQESSNYFPFFANYRYNPRHSLEIPSNINVPRAEELVKDLTDLSKELKKNLESASKNKKNMQIDTEVNLRISNKR